MKGFSSKRIALKVDVIGPENILLAGASVHHSAGNFKGWGSEGVKLLFHWVDQPIFEADGGVD